MRRPGVIVAAVAALVFAATWLVSSWLTSETTAPEEATAGAAPTGLAGPLPHRQAEPAAAPPTDALPPPSTAPEVARVGAEPLPVEVAESPFTTEPSAELDYAVQLLFGPDAGPDTWRSAGEVFERCLKQVPGHQRCYQGLVAAQSRLAGQDAGVTAVDLMPPVPSRDTTRHMQIRLPLQQDVGRPVQRR